MKAQAVIQLINGRDLPTAENAATIYALIAQARNRELVVRLHRVTGHGSKVGVLVPLSAVVTIEDTHQER